MSNTKIEHVKNLTGEDLAAAFQKFIAQKPGFESQDYSDSASYQQAYRSYKKDADFNRTLSYIQVESAFEGHSPEELAHKIFNQRLYIKENGDLGYIAGQYFPTEYQDAAKIAYLKAKRLADQRGDDSNA